MEAKKPQLYSKIFDQAQASPDAPAFLVRHRKDYTAISHMEVLHRVAAVRSEYMKLPYERIGYIGENSEDYFPITTGLIATGKTIAMLDSQAPAADLINVISSAELDAVIYDEDMADIIDDLAAGLFGLAFIEAAVPDFDESMLADAADWAEGDTLFFTSGTSKSSKVVVTPTYAIEGNITGLNRIRSYAPGQAVLMPTPYFHSYGFTAIHAMYGLGCPVIISSMKTLLKDIALADPVQAILVPSALDFLLKKDAINPSLKYLLISGSYLSPELAKKATDRGITVQNQYGSSEVPTGFASNLAGDPIDALTLSDTVKIELSPDGEVYIHTENHFKEYYKNTEDTEEMLVDGVVHSGDLGYLDEAGRLHLLGRRKNMILMENGDKVFYTDIDDGLNAIDCIDDAAAIYAEKMLIAVVAPKPGVTQKEIEDAIALYNTSQPISRTIRRIWIYGDKLPYTSSGKLARSVIEKQYPQVFGR